MAKILVVEDEKIVAWDLKNKLEEMGYDVPPVVAYGENVIQMVDNHNPDLILMDIELKGTIDGIQAAYMLQEKHDIPVVYLTAYADEATLRRARVSEPYSYIIKPFDERELHTIIEIAIYKNAMEAKLKQANTELEEKVRKRTLELEIEKEKVATLLKKEQELNHFKSHILNTISHEFRTPLTIISSSAYLISKKIDKEKCEKIHKHIDKIDTSIKGMTRLIENVVLVGKSLSRENAVSVAKFDLFHKIESIIKEIRLFDQGDHKIELQAAKKYHEINSDPNLLHLILNSLLSNARKFSLKDTFIKVFVTENASNIAISVSDEGIGIPEPEIDQIFLPFFRCSNSDSFAGMGLGLTVASKCASLIGAAIEAESKPGQGSKFTLIMDKQSV